MTHTPHDPTPPAPLARPWPNTYWLPGGMVLCGEYPGAKDRAKATEKLEALARFGVSTYIDLTTTADRLEPYVPIALGYEMDRQPGDPWVLEGLLPKREVHKLPIDDLGVPAVPRMEQILDIIDEAVAHSRTVYVHCWGGVGRTGTVAGCWLRRHGASPDEALTIINARWKTMEKFGRKPNSPETDEQVRFVRDWSERRFTKKSLPMIDQERRYRGTLLGGAVGDALGAPVEFMTLQGIREQFGKKGITDFTAGMWPLGSITDDTQMTLFTAEAMLRLTSRFQEKGFASHEWVAYFAYRRWLHTQDKSRDPGPYGRGWLVDRPELQHRRAPGATCLEGIARWEEGEAYTNNSKGCGGVMRAAPCGLRSDTPPERAYELAADIARITHRHPEGFVAAGVLAALIAHLREGASLLTAATRALGIAVLHRHEAPLTARLMEKAIRLATSGKKPTAARVESLGAGWVAEEALAIAVYCALAAGDDFAAGVRLAVNHSGDSDSTGAICGNILGAALGVDAIPPEWIAQVEARDVIVQLADDLATEWRRGADWYERYPPN